MLAYQFKIIFWEAKRAHEDSKKASIGKLSWSFSLFREAKATPTSASDYPQLFPIKCRYRHGNAGIISGANYEQDWLFSHRWRAALSSSVARPKSAPRAARRPRCSSDNPGHRSCPRRPGGFAPCRHRRHGEHDSKSSRRTLRCCQLRPFRPSNR